MINKVRILMGISTIIIVLISGCVQDKALQTEPTKTEILLPTVAQPSPSTPTKTATQTNSDRAPKLIVDKSGTANYTKIQDAINNSNNGDTILVFSGTYHESVDVNKQLILRGVDTGGGKPVVDAMGSSSVAITLSAGNSIVEGFKATRSAYYPYWYSAGILVNSNNNLLRNNTASNNYDGITLYHYSRNNTLIGNNVLNNRNWGIGLYYSHNNRLIGNNASKNRFVGIYLYYSSNNMLSNNNVSNNPKGICLKSSWLYPNDNNILIDNTILHSDQGLLLDSSNNNTLTRNSIIDNNYGIELPDSNNNTIYDNLFNNNKNVVPHRLLHNTWNTTKQPGINIIGGSYLGGNYWANPGRIDFSMSCSDNDQDGICDSSYTLDDNNSDFLPLRYKE